MTTTKRDYFKHESTGDLLEALKRYAQLVNDYEDVRLETLTVFNTTHYYLSYRYERGVNND